MRSIEERTNFKMGFSMHNDVHPIGFKTQHILEKQGETGKPHATLGPLDLMYRIC